MDVLIIGAGAAGLMAARELSKAGLQVCVLEARNRVGGRIYTLPDNNCGIAYEAGAEFIHGKLETTLDLLKEAGLKYEKTEGEFYEVVNGKWKKEREIVVGEQLILERLKNLKEDISVAEFLRREFPEKEHEELAASLRSYIEGYYSGDPERTSAKFFYSEWETEDEEQFRPTDGYGRLIQYLVDECEKAGVIIQLSTVIKEIRWLKDQVEVLDEFHHGYVARKVIIAIPLGVWQAPPNEKGTISYTPTLTSKLEAAKHLGFGDVVKILLEFKDVFWEGSNTLKVAKEAGQFSFVFSNTPIGTFWSQKPNKVPLLTGWVAGPKAKQLATLDDHTIIQQALQSISEIFKVPLEAVKQNLQTGRVFNWSVDPYTKGSYAYSTVDGDKARKIMMEPVENTLFFAGEALYEGAEMGTVEAALISGKRVAKEVLDAIG